MAITTQLQLGSNGPQVVELQQKLGITADGIFGPKTQAAVKSYQSSHGLISDGIVGPKTISSFSSSTPASVASAPAPSTAPANNGLSASQVAGGYSTIPGAYNPVTGQPWSISPTAAAGDNPNPNTTTADIPGLPASMQNLSVYNLPSEAFGALVPQLIPGTPEYQTAMDKISTAFYDVMQQQLNASTQEQQQAAQYSYNQLSSYIKNNLGITLSQDAVQAWGQIQGLNNQYSAQNIQGSGIENEAVDNYLKGIRTSDASSRSLATTREDQEQMNYYTKFATPQQIKDFIAANPDKAKQYGLIPSDDIKNSFTAAALKAKYPTMSDEDIQNSIASVLDENGNYRSNLYQQYMTGNSLGVQSGNVNTANIVYDQYGNPISIPVNPNDTGVLDIKAAKQNYLAQNTPLASQSADYAARVKLGSIPPTSGAASGTAAGTQFNQIQPSPSTSAPSMSNPAPTLSQPITVPGSLTSNGQTSNSPLPSTTPAPATVQPQTMPTAPKSTTNTSVVAQQHAMNIKNAGQPGWVPLKEDGIMGPKTQAAMSFKPTASISPSSYSSIGNMSTAPKYQAPTPTGQPINMSVAPKSTSTTSAPSSSSTGNIVNIDSNPSMRLTSGQKYSYQGNIYTQP